MSNILRNLASRFKENGNGRRFFPQLSTSSQLEQLLYNRWLEQNKVEEGPRSDYDNLGAFRAGMSRDPGSDGHFTDEFKLPFHTTFSNQSKYYQPGMSAVNPDVMMPGTRPGKYNPEPDIRTQLRNLVMKKRS